MPQLYNSSLAAYREVLRTEAERIDAPFIDLATLNPVVSGDVLRPSIEDGNVEGELPTGLTSNGVYLTSYGYQTLAPAFASALGLTRIDFSLVVDGDDIDAKGLNGITLARNGEEIELRGTPEQLPTPSSSKAVVSPIDLKLTVGGLPAGKYRVWVTNNSNGSSLRVLCESQLAKGVRGYSHRLELHGAAPYNHDEKHDVLPSASSSKRDVPLSVPKARAGK